MNRALVSRLIRVGGAGIAASACLVALASAAEARGGGQPAVPPSGAAGAPPQLTTVAVAPGAAAALASRDGITVAAATDRLARQDALTGLGARIEGGLADRTGGSYLDGAGRLVVTTLDSRGDTAVQGAGAVAQRVQRSTAQLDAVVARLDAMGTSPAGAGSVQGWYVDVVHNDVVVTGTAGATDARATHLLAVARSFGGAVRVETAPASQAPRPTDYLAAGYQFTTSTGGGCSVGFNMLDAANRNIVLTAGHCTRQVGNTSRNNFIIGANQYSNFPTTDFGTFYNSYPTYWQPLASVYTYQYGTYVPIKGFVAAPLIGSTVCKSGFTTGWTCGTITAGNQTVNYGTDVVRGLVRHNACVEPGDSGGANVNASGYALGMTSGAALPTSGPNKGKCYGGTSSVSWYQPIAPAMKATGLRLRIS